jgi:ribosomal-protein-serine acetyltransferase
MPQFDTRLPEMLQDPSGLMLSRWRVADAAELQRIVAESAEHLRPWISWMESEPLTVGEREAMLRERESVWSAGGDVMLAIRLEQNAIGSCGLHRRIAPDGLEIGYWVHPAFTRRGLATSAVRLLTDGAFTVEGITHVEIHHDKANLASAGVPGRLGYQLVAEAPDEISAPAELGIEQIWRVHREMWTQRNG